MPESCVINKKPAKDRSEAGGVPSEDSTLVRSEGCLRIARVIHTLTQHFKCQSNYPALAALAVGYLCARRQEKHRRLPSETGNQAGRYRPLITRTVTPVRVPITSQDDAIFLSQEERGTQSTRCASLHKDDQRFHTLGHGEKGFIVSCNQKLILTH